jgi:8-oxo-dGTP diphosphatase
MKFQGRTTTAIIPYPENRILLIKRSTPPFIGYWALPGGRVDPGETVEQTIVREVKEETGLDVELTHKVGDYHEKGFQGGYEYDYHPACFVVKPVGGEIKRQEAEIKEIKLFKLDELPEVLAFEHTQMIKDYVAQKTKKKNAVS